MMLGSVRIEGVWNVTQQGEAFGATATSADDLVYYDRFLGAHACIEQVSVEAMNMGILETCSQYPRMVKAIVSGEGSQSAMMNTVNSVELKVPIQELARQALMGEWLQGDPNQADLYRTAPDFSFKPVCVLNNTAGFMPYRKSGDIRLTINLARYAEALFGVNASSANTSYSLSEVRVTWRSVPDDGSDEPIDLIRHLSLKQNIQSSFASLQLQVPAMCDAMYASFLPQGDEGQFVPNTAALAKPPGVSRVEFLFNDATNKLITYQLRSEVEIAERYKDAVQRGAPTSAITLRNIEGNDCYGIGLRFGQLLDLNTQKLSVNLQSEISNADAYVFTAFFVSPMRV